MTMPMNETVVVIRTDKLEKQQLLSNHMAKER
jgi:hypothetical protein